MAYSERNRLGAARGAQLAHDGGHVKFGGVLGDIKREAISLFPSPSDNNCNTSISRGVKRSTSGSPNSGAVIILEGATSK